MSLPDYVVINDETIDKPTRDKLRVVSEQIQFPLSTEDKLIIDTLNAKFDSEKYMAGLAAPQIGFNKQAIIFAAPDDPVLKKWRSDLVQTMDKTIWINPDYEPVGDETSVDYESCFSVADVVAPVSRATTIKYSAYDVDGNKIEGQATGFLARLLQHEIDHLKGVLFIDLVDENSLESIENYRARRDAIFSAEDS